jgi:hypothetical protein
MPVIAIIPGPNSLKVAVCVFETMRSAVDYYTAIGLKLNEAGNFDLSFINVDGFDNDELLAKIFKDADYYGGCGTADEIELLEVEYNKPFAGFDLD